jgi:hypothetical protein
LRMHQTVEGHIIYRQFIGTLSAVTRRNSSKP